MSIEMMMLLGVIFVLPILPTFWAIFDIPKRRFATNRRKIVWFFTVSTLPCIGAILYIIVERRRTEPLEVV